jgi:hypothetical protein
MNTLFQLMLSIFNNAWDAHPLSQTIVWNKVKLINI